VVIYETQKSNAADACYAITPAFRSKGDLSPGRSLPYLIVVKKGNDEFSFGLNYINRISEQHISITVNNNTRPLYLQDQTHAWTYSSRQDIALLNDMLLDGSFVKVTAINDDSPQYSDYYSLRGLKLALDKMNKIC
jgi:hypothetical protein